MLCKLNLKMSLSFLVILLSTCYGCLRSKGNVDEFGLMDCLHGINLYQCDVLLHVPHGQGVFVHIEIKGI